MTESNWPLGFVIRERGPDIEGALLAGFAGTASADVSDALGRISGASGLQAYWVGPTPMCGPAVTVKTRPGDNLMIFKAIALAQAGDVLVVDGGGDLRNALVGGIMRQRMITAGLAGIVVDGAVRDLSELRQGGLPVFARGHSPQGGTREGPGEINVAISCCGMVVCPGDLVVGDADGVVPVPNDRIAETLQHVRANTAAQVSQDESGIDSAWAEGIDAILRGKGVTSDLLRRGDVERWTG